MKNNISGGNKIRILLHLFAWTIFLGLPLYFNKRWQVGTDFMWLYYINSLISGIIFYTNYLLLVPRFYFIGRKYRYLIAITVLLVLFYFVSDKSNDMVFRYSLQLNQDMDRQPNRELKIRPPRDLSRLPVHPPFRQIHLYNYSFNALFLLFFSFGMRVLERQSAIEKIQKEMEKEKLNSELAFLKNQISPHFFFNTLNNIYSLISINPEDSQKAVLKLSKLMRYLLYESETGDTYLSNEIGFMLNYIDLMKLRLSEKIRLSVSFPEKFEDLKIPPLLFIPFIENAFKHGISGRGQSFIEIEMTCSDDNIIFRCSNSISERKEEQDTGNSGIGLENVKKRLALLFPEKHKLTIGKVNKIFEIQLVINIT